MAEEEIELTSKEQGEAFLAEILEQASQIACYADFAVDDEGNISYEFKIDWHDYNVPFSEHFWTRTHTGLYAMWINEFYAKFWLWAAKSCRGTDYRVVCEDERYFVKYIEPQPEPEPEPQPEPEEGQNEEDKGEA